MKNHDAPWGKLLVIVSLLVTVLCTGLAGFFILSGRTLSPWSTAIPVGILAVCALFTVRGYAIGSGELLIRRLLWTTRLPLKDLVSARFEPEAMNRSLRLLGNGGLYSFTGLFRNKTLGNYRAFVTDLNRTVVLRFPSRTVVVSPAAPEKFVDDISADGGR